jgi:hypothetical protein
MAISTATCSAGTRRPTTRRESHQRMRLGSRLAMAGSSGTHFSARRHNDWSVGMSCSPAGVRQYGADREAVDVP